MCSAALSNAGWKVAFIREDLQFGLAPGSLRAHIRQRMRWVSRHVPCQDRYGQIPSLLTLRKQIVAGIEVHKQFGFYLAGSKFTSQMTWGQRGVGILQALRDYSPVTNVLALILLPIAIYPIPNSELVGLASVYDTSWLRSLFLVAFLAHKVNNYVMYGHIGSRRLASFQSMDIYCAPCKSIPFKVGQALWQHQPRSGPTQHSPRRDSYPAAFSLFHRLTTISPQTTHPAACSQSYHPPSTLRPLKSAAPFSLRPTSVPPSAASRSPTASSPSTC